MGRLGVLVFAVAASLLPVEGDVLTATWNMKWFPSGLMDIRNAQAVEAETVARGGRILREAVDDQCRRGGADLVVFVQEMRDGEACTNLMRAAGVSGLRLASISGFRDNGGVPLWQQDAILTTLPVLDAGYAVWSRGNGVAVPRGFAYALLDGGEGGPIACFSVHLKSNLNASGTEVERQRNIYKREVAAGQILAVVKRMRERLPGGTLRVLVGGDFNTNDDDVSYVSEATLRAFYGAHFRSCFRDLGARQRVTRPAAGGFPDATFDYILYRGFNRIVSRRIYSGAGVSDHNLVALRLR